MLLNCICAALIFDAGKVFLCVGGCVCGCVCGGYVGVCVGGCVCNQSGQTAVGKISNSGKTFAFLER